MKELAKMGSPFDHGNIYCQHSEEEIIIELFDKLPPGNKHLCDFGGRLKYSNSFRLLKDYGWTGTLVEKNHEAADELRNRTRNMVRVDVWEESAIPETVNELVQDADFLTIDIDSYDWWLWAACYKTPRVVCIEFNNHLEGMRVLPYTGVGQKNDGSASKDATVALGTLKGYQLAAITGINAIFVYTGRDHEYHQTN